MGRLDKSNPPHFLAENVTKLGKYDPNSIDYDRAKHRTLKETNRILDHAEEAKAKVQSGEIRLGSIGADFSKLTNPKDAIGTNKLPLSLVPASFIGITSLAFLEGMLKYGLTNWREFGVRSSVYVDAALRHILKYQSGEDADPVTKVPHLASAAACLAIIYDSSLAGKLTDDRPKANLVTERFGELEEVVAHLREMFKDKKPKHYYLKEDVDATNLHSAY